MMPRVGRDGSTEHSVGSAVVERGHPIPEVEIAVASNRHDRLIALVRRVENPCHQRERGAERNRACGDAIVHAIEGKSAAELPLRAPSRPEDGAAVAIAGGVGHGGARVLVEAIGGYEPSVLSVSEPR